MRIPTGSFPLSPQRAAVGAHLPSPALDQTAISVGEGMPPPTIPDTLSETGALGLKSHS